MQKITPFIWFKAKAEDAVGYYVSIFADAPGKKEGDSEIVSTTYYDRASSKASGMPEGSVMTVEFKLQGQDFVAINGGDYFKLSGAISFVVNCHTQEEIDYFWEKLSDGGEKSVCGWIGRDKFGVTWQITPVVLGKYLNDPNKEKASRVMKAMLKMDKIVIDDLEKAYAGK